MDSAAAADDLDARFAAAANLFDRKDFVAARQAFSALCQMRPGEAMFADRHAYCFNALGQWAEGCEAWRHVLRTHGMRLGRVNHLAQCLIELGDHAAARDALVAARPQVTPNTHFVVRLTAAALGAGDFGLALETARAVEPLGRAESIASLDVLAGLLQRLRGQGYGADILRLLDALVPTLAGPERLIRLGLAIAAALHDGEARLRYASHLARAEPDGLEGPLKQMQALADLGRFEDCVPLLAAVDDRFPPAGRTAEDDDAIGIVEMRVDSAQAWRRTLAAAGGARDFHDHCANVAALMTLGRHAAAADAASAALQAEGGHPWFMLLQARCQEALGRLDAALEWASRASGADPASTNALLHLGRLQLRAGLLSEADATAERLLRRHPGMPVVRAFAADLGREPGPVDAPVERVRPADGVWLHGGDAGDMIYALAAMQAGGGGRLCLTCIDNTREPMSHGRLAFLAPLLRTQPYIDSVGVWQGEPVARDFTLFRSRMERQVDLVTQQWRCVIDDLAPDVTRPWLTVPAGPKHGRPVFSRSKRYRNRQWAALWAEFKASCPDALFLGTAEEFAEFGHGEHVVAPDALALAQIIAGASVFVGNQSLPYAIAEGLKVGRLLEVSTLVPNCRFPGALALGFQAA